MALWRKPILLLPYPRMLLTGVDTQGYLVIPCYGQPPTIPWLFVEQEPHVSRTTYEIYTAVDRYLAFHTKTNK